ncbi:MAG: 6-phosphogluconolactonase, partial [Anaerolineales bacterium]
MNQPQILVASSPEKWVATSVDLIIEQAQAALHARGTWSLVLSGGNTPKPVYQSLAARKDEINWKNTF